MIAHYRLDAAIRAAAGYLVRHCNDSGQFTYRINLNDSVAVTPRYNLVRHAGCIYALVRYCQAIDDAAAREVVRRASRFLRQWIESIDGAKGCAAVCSRPEIEGGKRSVQCKLGASGLALAALSLAHQMDATLATGDELAALAKFLLYMQKPSGEFYSKFDPTAGRKLDEWTSLYYPGEAALGLLLADRCLSNSSYRPAAQRALEFLAHQRQHRFPVEADHWAILATLEHLAGLTGQATDQSILLRHVVQICESILHEQRSCGGDRPLRGWFTPDCRTTPAATRLEGLLAALGCLPGLSSDLQMRILNAVHAGTNFLLNAQLKGGRCAGGLPRASRAVETTDIRDQRRRKEVRIDYVQHALSVFLHYRYLATDRFAWPNGAFDPREVFRVDTSWF